jgi:hypothetical protein
MILTKGYDKVTLDSVLNKSKKIYKFGSNEEANKNLNFYGLKQGYVIMILYS